MLYSWLKEEERANLCEQCGQCEELCPQGISVAEWLEKAHQLLSEGTSS
jgi:predicted aldo/keto reductase-like oxidoreductase